MNKLEEIKLSLGSADDLYLASVYHKNIRWLIKRVQELEENIKQIHKEYGCELRDPNGTIWDHASELQEKVSKYETAFKLAQQALQGGE